MANSTMETTFQNLIKVIKEKTAPKNHTHEKADITDFPSSMPASDVYTWAKEPNKPSYTASEVDAFSATDGANLTNTVGNIQLDITQLGISKIGISQIGIAGGVASLDANARIPDIELPIDLIHTSKIGMANGVASLDANAKIPDIELPIDLIHTSKIGMANGVASLDANAKIPDIELPIDLIHTSQIGMAGGVASLGSDGKVPEVQLPPISSGDKIKGWRNIGGTSFYGNNVWTDGTDIYMSNGTSNQWVLTGVDPLTWANKTWNGYTNIIGDRVWTDGTDIYYSNTNDQYVLDKSTDTWSAKTWNWTTSPVAINGKYIWTDGIDVYYSNGSYQYVLDKATSTWSVKTWTGLTQFTAEYIWTDGSNIYFSNGNNQYVLDVATSTWSVKAWAGVITKPDGRYIWTDGENIYQSDGTNEYVYDKSINTWLNNAWIGGDNNKVNGSYIWTDGTIIFFNNGTNAGRCRLTEYSISNIIGVANGLAILDANAKLSAEQTNYVSTGRKSGTTVGNNSTAEGYNTTSSVQYAHAEGNQTQATASAAHAEGVGTKATAQNSHAEGWDSTASGGASHAEGYTTTASGNYSHAEGHLTKAQHAKSHAEGYNTQTGAEPQHVQGQYNIGKSDTAMEIGWGTSNVNRINIFEVYQNGNVVAAGNITDGSGNTLANMLAVSKVGIASGVASLDSNGHVPSSQIPGTVDEIKEGYLNTTDGKFYEESTYETEIPASTDKIYVDLSTNKIYRWGGSAYVEISASLALGDTSTTAFAGNRGKAIEDIIPSSAGLNNILLVESDIKQLNEMVNGYEISIISTSGSESLSGITVTLTRTDAFNITAVTSDNQTKYYEIDSDVASDYGLIEARVTGYDIEVVCTLTIGETKTVDCNFDSGDPITIDFYTPTGVYNLDVSYDIKAGGEIIDGNGNKLSGKANTSHTHTVSQITDFPSSMPASDVYDWAKASTKPSYSASEVGALSSSTKYAGSSSAGGAATSASSVYVSGPNANGSITASTTDLTPNSSSLTTGNIYLVYE